MRSAPKCAKLELELGHYPHLRDWLAKYAQLGYTPCAASHAKQARVDRAALMDAISLIVKEDDASMARIKSAIQGELTAEPENKRGIYPLGPPETD